jgi:hypothetical protein
MNQSSKKETKSDDTQAAEYHVANSDLSSFKLTGKASDA